MRLSRPQLGIACGLIVHAKYLKARFETSLMTAAQSWSGTLPMPELSFRLVDFRNWPEAAEIDVRSKVCYWGAKRTRYTHSEFCRS